MVNCDIVWADTVTDAVADPEGGFRGFDQPIDVEKKLSPLASALWPLSLSEGLRVLIYCGWVVPSVNQLNN